MPLVSSTAHRQRKMNTQVTAEYSLRYLIAMTWMIFFASATNAEQMPPPAEFWDYMIEFADDNANVIDPADYALMSNLPESRRYVEKTLPDATSADDNAAGTTPQRIRNDVGDAVEKAP